MSGRIQVQYTTSGLSNLYGIIRNKVGQVVRQTDNVLETYTTANLTSYDFPMTEQGTASAYYTFDFPPVPAGLYTVVIYQRIGTNSIPVEGDTVITGGSTNWDGTDILGLVNVISAGLGTGARTVSITVNDGTNPLQGATVRLSRTGETYVGLTSSSGTIVFNVNDGTWSVGITRSGNSFTGATLVVGGATTVTYSMTPVIIAPSSPGYTTGYLTVLDHRGNPEGGVQISTQAVDGPDGLSLDSTVNTTVSTPGTGLVQFINLVVGASYIFWRGTSTLRRRVSIPLTAGSTFQLPSVIGSP
jgi:hypothetical protein